MAHSMSVAKEAQDGLDCFSCGLTLWCGLSEIRNCRSVLTGPIVRPPPRFVQRMERLVAVDEGLKG